MIDAVLDEAPKDPLTATPALVEAYRSTRGICADLVTGTEAAAEFQRLFPDVPPVPIEEMHSIAGIDPISAKAQGDRAKLLLAGLSGWLGSWPSADELLRELITALETAEASAEGAERERLRGVLDGLRGAGRDIAVAVISAYLNRQLGPDLQQR
jgi:hypothetical protein